ncbi:MAG: multicopper oxidase domain-containing protein [Desulfobulbaceae bacterium]|nr:multicopper oxidase domain-containing protein [Desulfobulbaceae bacterium]
MKLYRIMRTSWVFAVAVSAMIVLSCAGSAHARAWIDGISGISFTFTAGAGEVSTADGGAIHFWGYQSPGANPAEVPQYPGPTLILQQNVPVTITLTSELPYNQCTSIVFPGHAVATAGGDQDGLLTRETCPSGTLPSGGTAVTYTFTPTQPGTYTYYSGTQMELQVEMGLVGTIIVRPNYGADHAYNHPDTYFDHEYLFMLTSMDPAIHQLAEQGRFSEIDISARWPVYWFINGRTAPDDLAEPFVSYLPHQPYNITPRMTPGQKILVRIVGGDQDQHPLHLHGNHYYEIARDGRMLASSATSGPDLKRGRFTTLSVPGQTVDAIFEWTGEKLGWDIYGTGTGYEHTCNGISVSDPDPATAGYDPITYEYCPDHGKAIPVVLPEKQDLAFGGWWSGSPFMGDLGDLPPGEGGLNPYGGFFFMWHSHAEKELTNFDIFPGGMLSMMVVEPPGTPID